MYMGARDKQAYYCESCTPGGLPAAIRKDWLATLQQRYGKFVRGCLVKKGIPQQELDDQVQELWADVADTKTLVNVDAASSWLGTIADWRASSYFRDREWQKCDHRLEESIQALAEIVDEESMYFLADAQPSIESELVVEALLGQLKPEEAKMVEALDIDGLNGQEAAEEFHCSKTHVHRQYTRGMAKLRSLLGATKPVGRRHSTQRKNQTAKDLAANVIRVAKLQTYHRQKKAQRVQLYPPIPSTVHSVQLYPPYTGF